MPQLLQFSNVIRKPILIQHLSYSVRLLFGGQRKLLIALFSHLIDIKRTPWENDWQDHIKDCQFKEEFGAVSILPPDIHVDGNLLDV